MTDKLALIVEDHHDTAEIFEAAIRNGGFTTEVIHDGQEALDRLQEIDPSLVLLDLHLPTISGDKILDDIIASPRLRDVRVIVASADGHLSAYQGLKKKERLIILQKPVSYEQLRRIAERLTGR